MYYCSVTSERNAAMLTRDELEKRLKCAALLPPPGDIVVAELIRSHIDALDTITQLEKSVDCEKNHE
jgi:hypothetical protein